MAQQFKRMLDNCGNTLFTLTDATGIPEVGAWIATPVGWGEPPQFFAPMAREAVAKLNSHYLTDAVPRDQENGRLARRRRAPCEDRVRAAAILFAALFGALLILAACGPSGPYEGRDRLPSASGSIVRPLAAREGPTPTKTWECSGAVYDCTSPGTTGHCDSISYPGHGDSEAEARKEGVEQCEIDLSEQHGGKWKCKDGTKLVCKEAAWKWKCAGPVPACACKSGGPGECPYVEGYGDKEKHAKNQALEACEDVLGRGRGCECNDASQLTCTEGSYPVSGR